MTLSVGFLTLAAWITMAAAGAVVTAFNLVDAYRDYRVLKGVGQVNGRMLVARVALWNEATRLAAHVLLLIAGILVAGRQINPNPPPTSLYVRAVILMTIVALVSQTISLRWLRRKLDY